MGYSKIYTLGHRLIADIFSSNVIVEEKVDGSQFSFEVIETGPQSSQLRCYSKNTELNVENPEKLFAPAVQWCVENKGVLIPGYRYFAEAVSKPKHNTLNYSRIPRGGLILFDVQVGPGCYLYRDDKEIEADRLGLELVPLLYKGKIDTVEQVKALLDTDAYLGNTKIEGIVIKNYDKFSVYKEPLIGKIVSEAFKEIHNKEWKTKNSGSGDFIEGLANTYRHENRWRKAVQHLRDAGELTDTPGDIGKLLGVVKEDVMAECKEEISEKLFNYFWTKKIQSAIIRGLPEWYKELLLNKQFGGKTNE